MKNKVGWKRECFSAEFSLVQEQRHLDGREMFQIEAIYRNTFTGTRQQQKILKRKWFLQDKTLAVCDHENILFSQQLQENTYMPCPWKSAIYVFKTRGVNGHLGNLWRFINFGRSRLPKTIAEVILCAFVSDVFIFVWVRRLGWIVLGWVLDKWQGDGELAAGCCIQNRTACQQLLITPPCHDDHGDDYEYYTGCFFTWPPLKS